MTKKIIAIALLAAVALAGCSKSEEAAEGGEAEATHEAKSSSAGMPAGIAEAGEKLASVKMGANNQSCVDCHGAEGNAPNAEDRPKIGGQYPDYIEHALVAYREGKRDNITMAGQAKDLNDQQIADLAAYFSSREGHLRDLDPHTNPTN
ncbi:c-type cytochrome [Lysobacter fragariae]